MRKYPKTTDYWVYAHRTPDNMYYPGQSKLQIYDRWKPSKYRTTTLQPYIEQYGWNNIEHIVVKDGLTKEQAVYWEERLRQMYSEMGCCINQQRSGHCTADMKEYYRQYNQRPERKEYRQQYYQQPKWKEYRQQYNQQYHQQPEVKEYHRQYRKRPEVKVYDRVYYYNHYHPDKVIETPKEAKQKYLETGYIPSYIRTDDLF